MSLLGVVFDFDGVIANTEALHLRAYQDTLADTPLSLSEAAYYERYLGYDDVGVFTALADDQHVTLEPEQTARLIELKGRHFESLVGTNPALFPGAADCVRRLAGATSLAIASGALHHEIDRILTAAALRDFFPVIVAADDVSQPKPAPDAYLQAVSRLASGRGSGSSGHFVAIEDSHWGLQSARDAGLKTIGITNSYPATSLTLADVTVDSLDEVDFRLLERLGASR